LSRALGLKIKQDLLNRREQEKKSKTADDRETTPVALTSSSFGPPPIPPGIPGRRIIGPGNSSTMISAPSPPCVDMNGKMMLMSSQNSVYSSSSNNISRRPKSVLEMSSTLKAERNGDHDDERKESGDSILAKSESMSESMSSSESPESSSSSRNQGKITSEGKINAVTASNGSYMTDADHIPVHTTV